MTISAVERKGMSGEDCICVIESLAHSQGMYSRMYSDLMEIKESDPDRYGRILDELESHRFADSVDFILFIEQ